MCSSTVKGGPAGFPGLGEQLGPGRVHFEQLDAALLDIPGPLG
jgi:hypothetical protein